MHRKTTTTGSMKPKVETGGGAIAPPLEKAACKLGIRELRNELLPPPIMVEFWLLIKFLLT